jgi:hypothetical protein
MVANRGAGNAANINWVSRSKKAKAKYYKEASRKRYERGEYRRWIVLANRFLGNHKRKPWEARCKSASSLLSHRMNPVTKIKAFSLDFDWDKSSEEAIRIINAKTKRSMKCSWNKKATVTAGTLRRRRDLRNAKSNTLQHTDG